MKHFIIIIVLILSVTSIIAQNNYQVVPYTLADRDRLIQVEANVNGMRNEMNSLLSEMDAKIETLNQRFDGIQKQFDGINQRLDNLQTFLYWGFGLLFSFMMFLFGFILWDRRTTLAPVKQEQDKILEVLKELSKKDSNIREALKKVALLTNTMSF
jgi:DNA repair exonuclease SbcCD ATPase subunit